ncbi:hypothetical protein ACFL96_07495 [Thermoproteota archaeon]
MKKRKHRFLQSYYIAILIFFVLNLLTFLQSWYDRMQGRIYADVPTWSFVWLIVLILMTIFSIVALVVFIRKDFDNITWIVPIYRLAFVVIMAVIILLDAGAIMTILGPILIIAELAQPVLAWYILKRYWMFA